LKTYFKILLFLILQSVICNFKSIAQAYPVQLSTQLVPPYSGYLPDYADPSSEKLKVILQFNDFTVAQYNVRLKIEIKGNGFTLTTKQLYNPPPLQIEPGVPFLLSGADLAPYLNSNNLDFVGINQSQYEQRMALPEGYYTICVKAYDYYNNGGTVQVSNEGCAQAWFTLSDPPFLNLPFCNASVTPQTPQNILFQWTPMNMGSPNSAFNTEYDFELWECRPDTNANPNQIALSTAPIFSMTTQQTVLNYGIVEPALNLYMKYVWRVRAHDISGRDLFKNQGYSQICTFNYGSAASVLGSALTLNLTAQGVTHRMGKCTWNTQSLFTSYKLQVRKQGTSNWFDYNTTQGSEKVTNLEPNTDYEAQVQGSGNGITSAWSNLATFRTNNEQNYTCNDQTQLADPLQAQPLPLNKAIIGLIIQTGQFEVITTQITPTGAAGWYSGKGYARVFGILPLAVQWSNIYIDDNNRHQQGVIQAMTKGIDAWVHQWDLDNAQNDPEVISGTISSFSVNNGQYCYTLQGSTQQVCDSFPPGTNVFVVHDDSGNEYTVNVIPPPPTVTGPTNYIVTSPDNMAACDSLMVTFEASQNQVFGFDAKEYTANIPNYECIKLGNGNNYFVPYKSIGETQTDQVLANIQINNFKHANLSFKTFGGTALTSTSITPTQYKITGIPATANCVYAYYNNKKVGKLNIVSLKPITKKVVIVPVNGASNTITANLLNGIYKQANVAFTVTTASGFNFSLGNDGLEAADATLLAKYSTEMRALRDAYKQANSNYDQDAYYIFVVPNFSNAQLNGYMVRGRALGFVAANATAKDVAHELAHGVFGLEHTFPKIDRETSNNLLDYGNGEKLTKVQWDEMRNPVFSISWNDTEEDGALHATVNNTLLSITTAPLMRHALSDLTAAQYVNLLANVRIHCLDILRKETMNDCGGEGLLGKLNTNTFNLFNNCAEELALNILNTTPTNQRTTVRVDILKNSLFFDLFDRIDGKQCAEFIDILVSWIPNTSIPSDETLLNEDKVFNIWEFQWNQNSSSSFSPKAWTKSDGNIAFSFPSKPGQVNVGGLPGSTMDRFGHPNSFVCLRAMEDINLTYLKIKKDEAIKVPLTYLLWMFETEKNKYIANVIRTRLDAIALVTSVGWVNQGSKFIQALRIFDIGFTATDLTLAVTEEQLLKSAHGQELIDAWNQFAQVYVAFRVTQTGLTSARNLYTVIKNKQVNSNTFPTGLKTKFDKVKTRLDDVFDGNMVQVAENVLTHIGEADIVALQKVTATLRSGGIRAINNVKNLVNEGKALVVKPLANSQLAQKMDDYSTAFLNNNSALQGQLGEEIAESMSREINTTGDVLNIKINNSGNGFDVLSFAPNKTNPTFVRIFEAKPLNGTSVELPPTVNSGTQMSTQWTQSNINQMINHSDPSIQQIGNSMNILMLQNKVERFVITIDKDLKQVIILKLDNF
jgi:hypothetical protein